MGGGNDGRYSLRRPSGAVCEEVVAVPKFDARPESLKQTAPPPTEATAPAPTARPGAREAPPAEPEIGASEGLDVDDALELPALDVDEALDLQRPRERRVHSEERLVVPGFDARQPEGPAVAAFRSLGVEALPLVAEAFPGLCWFDRRLPFKSLARGRDTGPLARVLAGFGAEASATVAELMRRPETDKRFYATLLGVDVGGDAVLEALAERILDSDLQTFDAAVVSLERWRDERGRIEAVLAPMREALPLAHVDRGPRLRYVTALHRLRDPGALEAFARALDPFDAEMAERAHLALRTLTGHDLGKRPEDWAKWVKKQAGKPRGRWLADALVGDDPMLVHTAVHELAGLGFDASAALEGSPRDRKKVRKAALRELA